MTRQVRNKLWVDLRLSSVDKTWRAWARIDGEDQCIAADWDKQRCLREARRVLKEKGK